MNRTRSAQRAPRLTQLIDERLRVECSGTQKILNDMNNLSALRESFGVGALRHRLHTQLK